MSLINTKYRTSVVNDFSTVSKATIYMFKKNNTLGPLEKFSIIDVLPVQINPNSLIFNHSIRPQTIDGLFGELGEKVTTAFSSDENASLRFALIYDIYDEYNIRTMNGITAGGLLESFSLENKDVTTLPKLKEYCGRNDAYALFRWGEMRYFGLISEISCEYETFSMWGEPLKCRADVVLTKQQLPSLKESNYLVQCFGKAAATQVKLYESKSNIANRAALTMLQSLR